MDLSAEVARRLSGAEAELQRRLSRDPHRPIYHFLPPSTWMNDPNGLIRWKGQYHLFYQYNPNGPFWGTMHWGHAVSPDLVHWTDLPVALAPTPGGPDADGCFSGCAVDDDGTPTLIYTGVRGDEQLPCIATSADDLLTWTKHPGNPVIPAPPPDPDITMFRDHSAWREGDTWYQVVGSGIRDRGGAALLYRSPDLRAWEYLHPLCVGDSGSREPVWTGTQWECPDFFPLDGAHALVVSVRDEERLHYAAYMTGEYADHRFSPRTVGYVDTGGHLYAPQTFRDDDGRRIMFGWVWEGRSVEAQRAGNLAGVLSLPRVLGLRPDGGLAMDPAPELRALRGAHQAWTGLQVAPEARGVLPDVRGDALEVVAEIEPGHADEVGIVLRASPDGAEETRVVYDRVNGRFGVDRARSSLSADATRDEHWGPLELADGEPLRLHILLDRSVVEVFANGRACATSRIYPSRPDSTGVGMFARGGGATLARLDLWDMRSIWEK
jgi:beta-fructofuranosidase